MTTGNSTRRTTESVSQKGEEGRRDGRLLAPNAQRPMGITAHIACSAHGGGVMLKPHVVPGKETIAAAYYLGVLEADVSPKSKRKWVGDEPFVSQQDLATSRASKYTAGRMKAQVASLLPRMPAGADLTPLDIYVNPKLKKMMKRMGLGGRKKLRKAVAATLGKTGKSKKILKKIKKTCLSFPNRVRRIAENGGRKAIRSKASKKARKIRAVPDGFSRYPSLVWIRARCVYFYCAGACEK